MAGPEGLPVTTLLTFPLLRRHQAAKDEVMPALEKVCATSQYVELSSEEFVRPRASGLPPFKWPNSPRDACGGVMLLSPIPTCSPGSSWIDDVSKTVKTAVENTVGHEVEYVMPYYPSGRCAILLKPFPCDRAICKSFREVGPLDDGSMLPIQIAYSHTRRQYLMMMPSNVRKEGQVRKRVKVDRPKMTKSAKRIRIRDTPKITQSEELSRNERWALDGYLQFNDDLDDVVDTNSNDAFIEIGKVSEVVIGDDADRRVDSDLVVDAD